MTCTAATLVLFPAMRAVGCGLERRPRVSAIPAETAQLTRFEERIDSLALELERIGEGQRYATKVLAEQARG